MSDPVADAIRRLTSDDGSTRANALADLIAQGAAATPSLIEALGSPDARTRALAAEGLATIADPAAADSLAGMLGDQDECVRARAAVGLANVRDGRALDALLRTIDDCPDEAHAQFTLSSYRLMGFGPEALPPIAPRLKAPDRPTREAAIWIVRENVARMLGGDEAWERLWASLGRYDAAAPAQERDRAADEWIAWIRSNVGRSHGQR